MADHPVLRQAEFDPKVKKYMLLSPVFVLTILIVTIPLAILWYIIAGFFVDRIVENWSCTLTERTLDIKKGIWNKTESTIPLEKITDLQMFQGPIMRYFGLHGFKVETAGQSSTAGGALVNMIGIVDTQGFRKAVLAQRDRLHDRDTGSAPRVAPSEPGAQSSSEQVDLLREMRDTLARIETHLKGPHEP
jgi:putative membrane protein